MRIPPSRLSMLQRDPALFSALTWPIDVILDLHRHLQRHRLWHKTPQRIATRLIAYDDLDHRVVFILGEGQG